MATFNHEHPTSLTDPSLPRSGGQRPAPGTLQTGRQRNHGAWRLPPELAFLAGAPLWQAVALWALSRGRPVSRTEISEAFSVAPRRAADVMTYIMCDRYDLVQVHKEVVRVASGHRVAMFLVTAVLSRPGAPVCPEEKTSGEAAGPGRAAEVRQSEREALAQARRLFLFSRQASPGPA